MQDIIQLLPDYVANQIAAGEVVQRPASIVKELLENSIDAGATKVELIVKDAGRTLVQVVDDGQGMTPTDARMAFERHATSKIRSTEDIFKIMSKGFRGEALASIAAVAQVELISKTKNATAGTSIQIEGGHLSAQETVPSTEGTSIAVKNLFFNVPARRKFLKNNNVEFRHIMDEFQRVALAHAGIEFQLYHNDENIFKLRKTSLVQRIVDVFGKKLQPMLLPLDEKMEETRLHGYVAKPERARKTRGEQFFFANGRFFRSPYLNKAVMDAFEGLLMPGYLPSFFLFLDINPARLDVNIHPQKTEVKFEDESLIFALIRSSIKKALGIYNVAPSLDFDRNPAMDQLLAQSENKSNARTSGSTFRAQDIVVDRDFNPFRMEASITQSDVNSMVNLYEISHSNAEPSKINLFEEEEDLSEDIMRLPNGYWIMNRNGQSLMINPARMHRLLQANDKSLSLKVKPNKQVVSNVLLFSVEYHLNEMEKNKFLSVQNILPQLGFDINLQHDSILQIHAVPEGLDEAQILRFIEGLLATLDDHSEEEFLQHYQNQWIGLHSKSRHDFIHKHDVLSLLKSFSSLGFPQFLPDGKRCYLELPLDEMANKF